jgi:hypothetical protein
MSEHYSSTWHPHIIPLRTDEHGVVALHYGGVTPCPCEKKYDHCKKKV